MAETIKCKFCGAYPPLRGSWSPATRGFKYATDICAKCYFKRKEEAQYKQKKDEVARKIGFVSYLDLLWTLRSFLRAPLTKFEIWYCSHFSHKPDPKTVIGNKTFCKRCARVIPLPLEATQTP